MTLLRRLGLLDRDGSWSLDVELRRTRLDDDCVAVEQLDDVLVMLDGECAVERRRKPQGDLDRVGVDERGEAP